MSNEDIIKEIEKASKFVSEAARDVKVALCHSRNVVENADDEKAYNKGLEDAWGLVKKLCTMSSNEMFDIWGNYYEPLTIVGNYTPKEALAKIEAYEKKQDEIKFKVGDVVKSFTGAEAIVTNCEDKYITAIFKDGSGGRMLKEDFKLTGRNIRIQTALEELKEGVQYE